MASLSRSNIDISVIEDVSDIPAAYSVVWACFGEQVPDGILQAFNPGWDTPDGYARAVERMKESFQKAVNCDKDGNLTKFFLKATVTDSAGTQRIAGLAIWQVLSTVEGYGDQPLYDGRKALGVEDLYPDDASEQAYCCTLFENLNRQRHELVEKQSSASPPAIMILDLCVVHPSFQRMGIASKLVQYGLDEAKRRGGLISCMEASPMGRGVYTKLGFRQEGPEIDYGVEGAKFAKSGMPSNVFMRT